MKTNIQFSSEATLMKGTRTLAFCAGELLRVKESRPGFYDLETIRPTKKPEIYANTLLAKDVESIVKRWCAERNVEYTKETSKELKNILKP